MYFITGNQGKLAEIQAMLPNVEQLDIDLPEIQSIDPKEIIAAKLSAAFEHASGEFIVEDTGLYLDCLNGLPGPLIKWFTKQLGNQGLAELAQKYESQRASAVTWIGYASSADQEPQFFEGRIDGTIVLPRGEGFGWDAIFQPEGHDRTFGEMSREEKNEMSMRKRAVAKLAEFLG